MGSGGFKTTHPGGIGKTGPAFTDKIQLFTDSF
jgi:hypothetical protein